MSVVYDTAVLVAADRNDRAVWAQHRGYLARGIRPVVPAPVVAQASRSPQQVPLRLLLAGCEIVPFASADAHHVGALAGAAGVADVVDAHVVLTAATKGAHVVTGDVMDLGRLAAASRLPVPVHPVRP